MTSKFKLNSRTTVAKDIFSEFLNPRIHTYFPLALQPFAKVTEEIREHYVTKHDVIMSIYMGVLRSANPLSRTKEEVEKVIASLITDHSLPIIGRFTLTSYATEVAKVMFENMIEVGGYSYKELLSSWLTFFAYSPDFCIDYEPKDDKANADAIKILFDEKFQELVATDFVPYKAVVAGKYEHIIDVDYVHSRIYSGFIKLCNFLPCYSNFVISKAIESYIMERRVAFMFADRGEQVITVLSANENNRDGDTNLKVENGTPV